MAEKKERQIIDVSSGKPVSAVQVRSAAKKPAAKKAPAEKKAEAEAVQTHAYVAAEDKKRAVGLRWGAVILWLAALGFEVLTILLINGYFYIKGNTLTYILVGLAADLICVVIGSQLWKKANHIDPASEKHKVRFFLWNNMGLIASLICFVPIIILLLKEKDLDEKTKKIATIVAVIVALIASGASVDWNPVSQEDLAAAQAEVAECTGSIDGNVLWTQFGKCYHLDENCQSLRNSTTLYTGSVNEAFEAKRSKPCSFCASEEAVAGYKAQLAAFEDDTDVSASDIVDFLVDAAAPEDYGEFAD